MQNNIRTLTNSYLQYSYNEEKVNHELDALKILGVAQDKIEECFEEIEKINENEEISRLQYLNNSALTYKLSKETSNEEPEIVDTIYDKKKFVNPIDFIYAKYLDSKNNTILEDIKASVNQIDNKEEKMATFAKLMNKNFHEEYEILCRLGFGNSIERTTDILKNMEYKKVYSKNPLSIEMLILSHTNTPTKLAKELLTKEPSGTKYEMLQQKYQAERVSIFQKFTNKNQEQEKEN